MAPAPVTRLCLGAVQARAQALSPLGVPEWRVRLIAFTRRGPWFMAGGPLNGVLTLDYWRQRGLVDLPARYAGGLK